MAVFYKWIKGCAPGASLGSGQWSYISWGTGADIKNTNSLPVLKIFSGRNDSEGKDDLGYFLTSKAPTPTIVNQWNFTNGIKIGESTTIINNTVTASTFIVAGKLQVTENIIAQKDVTINNNITVEKTSTLKGDVTINKALTVEGPCTAVYFNATSDKRAKENIAPVDFSALDVIKSLPIYTFNYKKQSDKILGILAQDLFRAVRLDLVNNVKASGEDGDYMTIKEDKLVYICMKAIQELTEKINNLENELNILKSK